MESVLALDGLSNGDIVVVDERTTVDRTVVVMLSDTGPVKTEVEKVEGGEEVGTIEDDETWMYGPHAYIPCIFGALIGQRKFLEQT